MRPEEKALGSAAVPWTTEEEKTEAEAALLCEGVRRCDSERRRRSSRSCARRDGASSGRALAGLAEAAAEEEDGEGWGAVWSMTLEDWSERLVVVYFGEGGLGVVGVP